MDPKSLAAQAGEVQVIDVREPFEWDAGRIEGSRHIPLKELPHRLDEIDRERPAVAVCFAGARSAYASEFLQSQGFHALNLDGGLQNWVGQGLPLSADGDARGRLVHDPPNPGTEAGDRQGGGDSGSDREPAQTGELPPEMDELKNMFIEVVFAAQERFGDEEPAEEEMRRFMKEWLISKGKTAEEAEEILNR